MALRKYNRYRLEIPVIFAWKGSQDVRQQGIGLTRDLSLKGAFIRATTLPPSGVNLEFKVFLPPSRAAMPVPLCGKGHVVRVDSAPDRKHTGFAVATGKRIVLRGEDWSEQHFGVTSDSWGEGINLKYNLPDPV